MEAAVAQGVLKGVVGTLGTFLWNEAVLLGSIRQDIQFIKDELQSMDCFVQDVVNSSHPKNQLKVWMLQVLELACDAELCVEDFTKVLDGRYGRGKRAAIRRGLRFLCTLWTRYWTAKTIQELKSRAKEVSERRSRYNFADQTQDQAVLTSEEGTASQQVAPQPSHLIRYNRIIEENSLVGNNMDIVEKLNHTIKSPPSRIVVAIVGPAGSGKTAVAKMLYRRRNEPKHNISGAAWVTLSQPSDIKMVLKDILRQIIKRPLREIQENDEERLKQKLKEELEKQSRFLIILDSLSKQEDWEKIKPALPERNADRDVVVVTTRLEEVAHSCQSTSEHFHTLKTLSKDHHNEFIERLLSDHFSSRFHSEEVERALKYCCAIPLALKCLCGMLAGADVDIRTVNQAAIDVVDIMMQNLKDDEKVAQIIQLCYNYMPSILKKCLLDVGVLPEGYAIKRKRLIRKWIAKGFVSSTGVESEEEIAEDYVEELISRCVFKPDTVQYSSGRAKICTINAVFRDISSSRPMSLKHKNSPQESSSHRDSPEESDPRPDSPEESDPRPDTPEESDPRPDSPEKSDPRPDSPEESDPRPDSPEESDPDPNFLKIFEIQSPTVREELSSKNYTFQTILDFEGFKGLSNHDLKSLSKFIQLKFLSLRNTDVSRLPKKIGELKHLQTLDIRQTKIDRVPRKIVNLHHLKHFLAGHSHKPEIETAGEDLNLWTKAVNAPEGIQEMTALQTLANINATKASKLLHVVRDLKNLKKLGIVIEEKELNTKPLCISIMMLSGSLRSLSVCDERVGGSLEFLLYLCFPPQLLKSLNLKGHLGKLPQWISEHKHLSKLTLSKTQLTADSIKSLGKVRSLVCLKLYNNSLGEHVLTLSEGEFEHLQIFVVYCSEIKNIFFKKGTMPELKVFKWVLSKNQMCKVEGIVDLPMLKQISLIGHVSETISNDINYAIEQHPNRKSGRLVLEKIEQEIREHNYARRTEKRGFTEKCKVFF